VKSAIALRTPARVPQKRSHRILAGHRTLDILPRHNWEHGTRHSALGSHGKKCDPLASHPAHFRIAREGWVFRRGYRTEFAAPLESSPANLQSSARRDKECAWGRSRLHFTRCSFRQLLKSAIARIDHAGGLLSAVTARTPEPSTRQERSRRWPPRCELSSRQQSSASQN
jgi:hypothetical protein